MITIEALKEAGYREHKPHKGDRHFQKWICASDPYARLFAVNFYVWYHPLKLHGAETEAFSAEARLYQNTHLRGPISDSGCPETSFDLDLMVGDVATVQSVENFFVHAYTALDCLPDILNQ